MRRLSQHSDRGVSAIVGVITLVAITIILSTVLLTSLGSFLPDDEPDPSAEVLITETPNNGTVTIRVARLNPAADRVAVEANNNTVYLNEFGDDATVAASDTVTITAQGNGKETLVRSYEPQG